MITVSFEVACCTLVDVDTAIGTAVGKKKNKTMNQFFTLTFFPRLEHHIAEPILYMDKIVACSFNTLFWGTKNPDLWAGPNLTNLIGWKYETKTLRTYRKSDRARGWFLVFTNGIPASGDENETFAYVAVKN